MPNTTAYEFGDVVLVEIVFTNQRQSERRPAVVINTAVYSLAFPDVIVMPITSQSHQAGRGAVEIQDWQGAGLIKRSYVKLTIGTYEKPDVIRQLGKINSPTRVALKKAIAGILGFKQTASSVA
jgi:mRNA-degrading endonuclease toxin of MazEF toxin-antitoxin module